MRKLIFVHGINNQGRSAAEITETWGTPLRKSLGAIADGWWDGMEIRSAYYGDVLHAEEQSWDTADESGQRMSVDSPDDDYAPDDVAALYLALQQSFNIDDAQVAAELDPEDDRAAAERMAAGVHKKWLKAIARTLEKVVPSAGGGLARAFLAQAAAYLHKPGVFDKINALVQEQVLDDIGDLDKTVVVGHSLGTIVTYVLLRRMPDSPNMPLFVTLGSPLGIDIVRKRIGMPYVTPPVAKRWVNGSDPEDFVALHPALDAHSFGPAKVDNFDTLDNGEEDAHSIERYIAQPPIVLAIGQALS